MLHMIGERLLLLLRAVAQRIGGALVRWSDDGRHGGEDAEPQASVDTVDSDGETQQENGQAGQDEQDAQAKTSRSTAELVTTAVSLLLISVLVGLILYDGYASGASVPATIAVIVDVDAARREGDVFYVPFEVRNAGDQTIEQVLVTFKVYDGDELVVETETVIPLLGERGHVSGTLVLEQDPSGLTIESRVSTFQSAEE